jgi:hypothetical protein
MWFFEPPVFITWLEWRGNGTNVAEEYCWAITQAVG